MKIFAAAFAGVVFFAQTGLWAMPTPVERHVVSGSKSGHYFSEGLFAGGDKTVTSAKLRDIRRGPNPKLGFERVVLDLDSDAQAGMLPHFEVNAVPAEGKILVSIWADVNYDFDGAKVQKAFAKSTRILRVNPLPRVEDGLTIIEFFTKPQKKVKVEVFKLSNPGRIILDLI